jgi:predicted amidophosphoribosyltransferase
MNLATRYCPECREDRPFDRPHQAGYCPECGLALVIAVSTAAHAPAELRRTERAA